MLHANLKAVCSMGGGGDIGVHCCLFRHIGGTIERSDIAHRVTFSKLPDFRHYNLDLKQILVKFNSTRQLGYQADKPQ